LQILSICDASGWYLAHNTDYPVRSRDRQRADQHQVHFAEKRSIGTDAHGQNRHSNQNHKGILSKEANRLFQITPEYIHVFGGCNLEETDDGPPPECYRAAAVSFLAKTVLHFGSMFTAEIKGKDAKKQSVETLAAAEAIDHYERSHP